VTKHGQNLVLNEIAAKTCKIKSENQVKGKVKAKTTTAVLTIIIRHNVQNVGRDLTHACALRCRLSRTLAKLAASSGICADEYGC
jgi:hypothetical protein